MWSGQRNAWSSFRTSAAGWTRLTFLAMQAAVPAGHTTRLLAALLGHQHRPDDSAVGSLAALLWRERCRARGQHIPALKFAGIGLGGVPIILTAAWATLLLTG